MNPTLTHFFNVTSWPTLRGVCVMQTMWPAARRQYLCATDPKRESLIDHGWLNLCLSPCDMMELPHSEPLLCSSGM